MNGQKDRTFIGDIANSEFMPQGTLEIKICTRSEYDEFLNMINDGFGYGAENRWFQKNQGHCTPEPSFAADKEIACHFYCVLDGQMAGGLGAYPMDWVVANSQGQQTVVKAYGIGQVCCLPRFRNRGVMTALLRASERVMREQGRSLGYLSGDRFRYGYFGYDFGGNTARYSFDKWRFGKDKPEGLTIRRAELCDWRELDTAYNKLSSRILRDARAWERQLRRENVKWFIGEKDGRKGYIAYDKPEYICEVYGDFEVVAEMLKDVFANQEINNIQVNYPMQNGVPDAMGRMLFDKASWAEVKPLGLISVVDMNGLCKALAPLTDAEPSVELSHRLMGYVHRPLPEGQEALLKVNALNNWISEMDFI